MMNNEQSIEERECFNKMHKAYKEGNLDEYHRLEKELDKIIEKEHAKKRRAYQETFGVDIDEFPYIQILDLKIARNENSCDTKK